MKIQYLGTAAAEGWPAVFCNCAACTQARRLGGKDLRTRAQAIVDDTLLLDFPPDSYAHALRENINFGKFATLLVTHSHQDHFYPEELLLRGAPYAHAPLAPMLTVYGNDAVHAAFDRVMAQNDSPDLAQHLRFCEVSPFHPFLTPEGYRVTPVLANHMKDEACLLYLIEKDGKRLLYAHDSGVFPAATWEYLAGRHLDFISFDCTSQADSDGNYHMGLPDDAAVRDRLASIGCVDESTGCVVSHFSHNGGMTHAQISAAAEARGFHAAYDGCSFTF
jgi:phosphoribosyl 1,2-cyclic phosphate phosphodiesterase